MKQLATLCAALALILVFWNHAALFPLKLLVVFFHESSHALMTIITGGEVVEFVVNRQQGGHVISRGGMHFATLSAGYLGSLLWGAAIYLVAARTRKDAAAMFLLGALILAIALFFIRSAFGLLFAGAAGGLMLLSGAKAGERINDFILQLIGLTSMVYAPLDIYSDTISRSHLMSDARMIAEAYGGPTIFWGGLWIIISAFIIFLTIRSGLKARDNLPEKETQTTAPSLQR